MPYQAQITWQGIHACGGSIVSRKSIVTAGHCVDNNGGVVIVSDYIVHVGSAKRTTGGVFVDVASIVMHPHYQENVLLSNDIAILKLTKSLTYTSSIQPISLPTANYVLEQDSMVFISGFGSTENSLESSEDLLYSYIPVRNFTQCSKAYSYFFKVQDTQFCAGSQGKVIFSSLTENFTYLYSNT